MGGRDEHLRRFGNGIVDNLKLDEAQQADLSRLLQDDNAQLILQHIWDTYGRFSSLRLLSISRLSDSPWGRVWQNDEFGIIPDELIQDYYSPNPQTLRPNQLIRLHLHKSKY